MHKERKIVADDYGFMALSIDTLETFISKKRIRSKKLLSLFSRNKELFNESIQQGIFLPINQIAVCSYQLFISVETDLGILMKNWDIILEEGVYNLKIGIDGNLWFIALVQFNTWHVGNFQTQEDYCGYWVESGPNDDKEFEYIAQRFNIEEGEYLVRVLGLKRKDPTYDDDKDYGYYFELTPTNLMSENIIQPEISPNFNMVE